jgi:hypothetical protein
MSFKTEMKDKINSAKVAYKLLIKREIGRLNVGEKCVIWVCMAKQTNVPYSIGWDRERKKLDVMLPFGKEG